MANIIVDGFATYGTYATSDSNADAEKIIDNMQAGAYAECSRYGGNSPGPVPWDLNNKDTWFRWSGFSGAPGARRVLPNALSVVMVSMHVAMSELPSYNGGPTPISFRDNANYTVGYVLIQSTGAVSFNYGNGTLTSSGPVILAEKDHHFEMQLDMASKNFALYVDGAKVIDGAGLNFSNTNDIAQVGIGEDHARDLSLFTPHVTSLIIRDDSGSYNNTFPIGDRRVATLIPNRDDPDNAGWNDQPLHRFGVGVLRLPGSMVVNYSHLNSGVLSPAGVATDIGANDFTLEGQFRFQNLPIGAEKATLFGKWDEDANGRSYELYLGGPNLDNGLLVWRTSTDGTGATVSDAVKWRWKPDVGHWYHVAMCRDAGVLKLFIDGVQQGLDVADSDAYFAGDGRATVGAETDGSSVVDDTSLDGWQDEFRFTLGLSRYSANFAPPSEAFPRNASDSDWGSVVWLSSWDNGTVTDDGPNAMALTSRGDAAAITPNDGLHDFEVLDKTIPNDDTFLEAALIAATGLFTMTLNPSDSETVTVGKMADNTDATYTFVTTLASAYDVLIGADTAATAANLTAAVNKTTGEGSTYGTGTAANASVSALQLPSNQVRVTALTPGTAGNSIASTETCANASWGATTLDGGLDIPPNSQFGFSRLPSDTTIVDSITFAARQWKTDSGTGSTKLSMVGLGGGGLGGTANPLGTIPNLTFDTFEADPDTGTALTATTALGMQVKIDRTV